ncbi:hypothetical protein T552_02745 [Pneumocystis carinii B80]|uniref:Protein LST8 homolog n=1 Tax=Pneumocystis carinii (strain B80) TaxID=1408658 RepID=A0A0W4ZED6_PNEC8|nr:hypothetical protein T552_02745 [Pneumocystis carinii B80]KTW26741.1 hypothetical protein T552_02745 [Pneumocystis carinii B80]
MHAHTIVLVTSGYDRTIRFWEALSGICLRTIQHADSQVNRLCISPDKRLLAAAGNRHIRLYDIQTIAPSPILTLDGHATNVTGVTFHGEGKWVVTSGEDGSVKLWDLRTSSVQRHFRHGAAVNDVVVHPNQGDLISCDQTGCIKLWDLKENLCTGMWANENEIAVHSISVANDGSMLVAGNNEGICFVWYTESNDLQLKEPDYTFQAHKRYITRCLVSPDAKHLATCSADATIKLWSREKLKFSIEKQLVGHQRWVWDCAFSADSAYLVSASSDHVARLWELSSGETIRQYNGHHKAAVCVALNDKHLS